MVLPLIARAAPVIARGVMALRKGKKIKDMGMADVVDVPVLRIADAMKKARGTSVAAKAATAAVASAALADGAAKPSAKSEAKPKASTAEAKGRRGGRIGSESAASKPSAAAPKPSASAPAKSKINPLGRKLDKNGAPIIGKAELEKSGLSLRDFLNKERNLKRRADPVSKAPLKKLKEIDVMTGKEKMAKGGMPKKKK
jgi:lambda repressor-like predicted transcriptional regulator